MANAQPHAYPAVVTGAAPPPDMPVIDNPISGETIVIRRGAAETGGALLAWDLLLAPGGRVPSTHAHPEQEERFTVLDGVMRFRVRGRPVILRAGETLIIPAGTVHRFANAGREDSKSVVNVMPGRVAQTTVAGAWYHDAAIQEAERARKN